MSNKQEIRDLKRRVTVLEAVRADYDAKADDDPVLADAVMEARKAALNEAANVLRKASHDQHFGGKFETARCLEDCIGAIRQLAENDDA